MAAAPRKVLSEIEFALPEPVAETRSIALLLDLVASGSSAPVRRHIKPSAHLFRASLCYGGRAQQSKDACSTLFLADTNEDYLAQVVSRAGGCDALVLIGMRRRALLLLRLWAAGT